MRRTGGKLIAKSLAFWLAVGLGFFGVSVPRWPLAAEPIVAHEAWQVLETSGSVRYQAPAGAYCWQAATGSEIPPGSRIVTEGGKVSQAGNKSGKSTQGGSDSKGNKDDKGNNGKSSGRSGGGSSGGGGGGSGGSGRN
jgi:hypothetical protein